MLHGGIVGVQNGVTSDVQIKNVYNIGNIIGDKIGGIMNSSGGIFSIENCYNAGNLEGKETDTGGIVGTKGSKRDGCSIINCFYLDNVENSCLYEIKEINSEKLTVTELKGQYMLDKLNNYISSDSNLQSWIHGNNGYPNLK